MTIAELMGTELPMNRKERYFTGTVFPMIVCRDNFQHFEEFASLIPEFDYHGVCADADSADVQFFTEYSFVESVCSEKTKNRFPEPRPKRKDTPDIMILIAREPKTLLAIEAKMYVNSSSRALVGQMKKQEEILDYLKKSLGIRHVHHCALLPEQRSKFKGFPYRVMTWEDVLDKYEKVYPPNDYFMGILRYSLDSFDEIGPRKAGVNADRMMSGAEISREYRSGQLKAKIIGRRGGMEGIDRDISSKSWQERIYQTNTVDKPFNANWVSIAEFVKRVDGHA